MASEIQVRVSVTARKGYLDYSSPSNAGNFNVTMEGEGVGPAPGLIYALPTGTTVDFSGLGVDPGICWIQNQSTDASNYVTLGAYDPDTGKFYPLFDIYPGEAYPCRISQLIGQESGTSGTGTTGEANNGLMIKSAVSSCPVLVQAIPR